MFWKAHRACSSGSLLFNLSRPGQDARREHHIPNLHPHGDRVMVTYAGNLEHLSPGARHSDHLHLKQHWPRQVAVQRDLDIGRAVGGRREHLSPRRVDGVAVFVVSRVQHHMSDVVDGRAGLLDHSAHVAEGLGHLRLRALREHAGPGLRPIDPPRVDDVAYPHAQGDVRPRRRAEDLRVALQAVHHVDISHFIAVTTIRGGASVPTRERSTRNRRAPRPAARPRPRPRRRPPDRSRRPSRRPPAS